MKFQSLVSMSFFSLSFLFFFLAVIPAKAHAPAKQDPKWERLGARKVNYGLDRDEIPVTVAEGFFTAINLRVKNAPINLHRCVIHFANGGTQEVEFRKNIPAGGQTRVVDLEGGKRAIQKVVFWYDTKNIAVRRGEIEVWGRH